MRDMPAHTETFEDDGARTRGLPDDVDVMVARLPGPVARGVIDQRVDISAVWPSDEWIGAGAVASVTASLPSFRFPGPATEMG